MRITTSWVAVLLLLLLSTASSEDSGSVSREKPEPTTENGPPTSSVSNNKSSSTNNGITNREQSPKLRQNDDNDVAPARDIIMDDLLFFESLINGDEILDENQKKLVHSKENKKEKSNKIDNNSENPVESKVSIESIDIRRQGELKHQVKPGKSRPDIQYDDSKQEVSGDSKPRFGVRKSKQGIQDETPVLQLTQGGYSRPFRQHRFRNRYISRPDSSEQSTQVQEPDRSTNDNRTPETRPVPQVTYSSPTQQLQAFGPRPILSPPFETPRNMLAIHHVVPSTIQSSFFNTPPTSIAEFTTLPFQAQFPQGSEVRGFPNFGRDSNNAALYQVSQRNPFQTPGVMFQSAPEVQTQPMLAADTARNLPPQFHTNPFTPYPGFEDLEDNSRPNYAMYFRNPTANNQFQVPPNFYATVPNSANAFNGPPINFLSNYPNSDDRLSSRLFRYPATTDAQNNRQNSNDQQLGSDTSQEDKKAKVKEQETVTPTNRDDTPSALFGERLQVQNEADVYMRYPTNEAGYAIEENLPSQNNSEAKDNSQETNLRQRNFPIDDPFRNGLNSIHTNQRINNSYEFPPELFRNIPLAFGYQRPQSQIFLQYPERNRELPRYPGPNFGDRGPFDPIPSSPENNYQFLNLDNQRQRHRDIDGTPSCAKKNNASTCFEDSEYPRNDILYSLNSNSFLADRLSGPEMPLNSEVFVERNATGFDQTSESYACPVETKYGFPLRAKNLDGAWRIIVNIQDKFSQPVRMEVCKSLGDPCSYVSSQSKTTCVQKYSLQRLISWNPGKGIYSDVYRIPVACSCQILKTVEA